MKRFKLFWVAVFLIVVVVSGCSEKKAGNSPKESPMSEQAEQTKAPEDNGILNLEGQYPITKEPVTMSMATIRQPNSVPADQMWFFKWIKEKTNINFNVTQIEVAAWNEQKNILFASGNLPDIFLHADFTANDITQFGQFGQQFMPLNDLIEQYAPSIKKLFAEHPEVKAAVTSPDGNIYSLPSYFQYPSYSFVRAFIHKGWLDKLKLEEPETLDDLYNLLVAFKEQDPNGNGKPDEIPFGGSWEQGYPERTVVLAALGFNADALMTLSVKEGKVVLPEADPLYAEYLKYMHKLNVEGLMDKEIFTQTQVQAQAKSSQNLNGLVTDGAPHIIDPVNWKEYSALKPLTSEWNTQAIWPNPPPISIGRFMITKDAKQPEAAIRFADLFFTEEFGANFWYGPKKDSEDAMGYAGWYINDKNALAYDLPEGVANNWDYQNTLSPINGYNLGYVPDNRSFEKLFNTKIIYEEKAGYWRTSMDERVISQLVSKFPDLYLSEAETNRRNELFTPINDYVKTMEAKFITGNEKLTDDNLDKYFNELKKLGVEEYVQIYQNAYDIYVKALN